MLLRDIYIRDPYILPVKDTYYLYGKSCRGDLEFVAYSSKDLENWSEAKTVFSRPEGFWATKDYWAPEVHAYRGKFYMFASFKAEDRCRATQILVADSPEGPFAPLTSEPITPPDWECLDGTLYVDPKGIPYVVFCHEWLQVGDGTMCYAQLSEDLTRTVTEPVEMFAAHDFPFVKSVYRDKPSYVTDGPCLYRCADGKLLMTWSSFAEHDQKGYFSSLLESESGELRGPWKQQKMLFDQDGGHGMLFHTFDGQLMMTLHCPNSFDHRERALLLRLEEKNGTLSIL